MYILILILVLYFVNDYWLRIFLILGLIFILYLKYPIFITRKMFLISRVFDKISISLVYLSVWIIFLLFLGRKLFYSLKFYILYFKFFIYLILTALILSFIVDNFMHFYIFFERSLIPIFFIVYGWGAQPERIEARHYLIFYTLFGSLPLLFLIIYINNNIFRTNYYNVAVRLERIRNLYLIFILAFLVKIPIFYSHLWLPKVHVEAPLSGSILLAAILLKLGSYGLVRALIMSYYFYSFIYSLRLLGGRLVALSCLQQRDLKTLVAYSSVVHIRIIIGGLIRGRRFSSLGRIILIIAHGLCSSCLFCLVNSRYERTGSRRLFINKGMLRSLPSFRIWWFISCSYNISAPFSLNLFREVFLILRIIKWRILSLLLLFFLSFLRSAYRIFIFSYTQHNSPILSYFFQLNKSRDHYFIFSHIIPLILRFLFISFYF